MVCDIHVGDVGVQFQDTVQDCSGKTIDISSVTTKEYIFQSPDGSSFTTSASFLTNGTDGVLTYTTVAGDISVPGRWRYQVHVIFPSTLHRYSDFGIFMARQNLPE